MKPLSQEELAQFYAEQYSPERGEKGDKGDPGPEGPQGPKGDRGEKGEKGDTPVLPIFVTKIERSVDKPMSFVVYYSNNATDEVTLDGLKDIAQGNAVFGGGGGLTRSQVINIINETIPESADNVYVQEECPNDDTPHLWIRTCSNGRINFLVKR